MADSPAPPPGREPRVDATPRVIVEHPAGASRGLGARPPAEAAPRVHIGQVEVVITAPLPPQRSAPPATGKPPDTSRLYLRSL
ncbi:MAG: hypothetical protein OES32_06425 [Acidobacteriota bacterium]|nr:hypothetical protein [Acidobacteriota bacterium]MDH3523204.1 hypothetical protein [Acidobacteriota bacterium]